MAKLNVKDSQFLLNSVVVAQVKDGNVDLGEVSMIDTTSTTDGTNTQVAGVRETMAGTITVQWDPTGVATHASLMSAYLAKTLLPVGFLVRDNVPAAIVKYEGNGFIINVSAPIAVQGGNGAMECTFRFKLAGAYTKT